MSEKSSSTRILWIILILIFLCICLMAAGIGAWFLFSDNNGVSDSDKQSTMAAGIAQTMGVTEESPALSENTPTPESESDTWLVMLYQDADDHILEYDIFFDLNEAEVTGSSDKVHIVSQLDLHEIEEGPTAVSGWSSAKRLYVTKDSNLDMIASTELADLGEVNMGDPNTLIDFATWAINTYPADKYAIIMSDHGGGWTGGWIDPAPVMDSLNLNEMDDAFNQIVTQTGIGKFDLIGLDACLMSQLDVYTTLAPYGKFAVASEETEPGTGWAYAAFLQSLVDNPKMGGDELALAIVDSYLEEDQRIVNDRARAQLAQGNTQVSIQQVLDQVLPTSTLSAVDLSTIPALNAAFNEYANYLTTLDQVRIAASRNFSPYFASPFGKDTQPPYIDLYHFSLILETELGNTSDSPQGTKLREAINNAVIKNKRGSDKIGAQGISIYFPNSVMYVDSEGGYESYTRNNGRFMQNSLWDEFLAFHYAQVTFDPQSQTATIPSRSADVAGPGSGEIQVAELALSNDMLSYEEPLNIQTTITGNNIGYIHMQYGWYFEAEQALAVLGMDFLRADNSKVVGDIYYPDWGTSGTIDVDYTWTPSFFLITDGSLETMTFGELVASNYGASEEDTRYAVPGLFTYANSNEKYYVEMNFDNEGNMIELLGYTGEAEIVEFDGELDGLFDLVYPEGDGETYPITPSQGDIFTPFIQAYLIEEDVLVNIKMDPITFSDKVFYLAAESIFDVDLPYYVAIVPEDLDGNMSDAVGVGFFDIQE